MRRAKTTGNRTMIFLIQCPGRASRTTCLSVAAKSFAPPDNSYQILETVYPKNLAIQTFSQECNLSQQGCLIFQFRRQRERRLSGEAVSKSSERRMNAGFDTSLRSYSTGIHPKIKQPCLSQSTLVYTDTIFREDFLKKVWGIVKL